VARDAGARPVMTDEEPAIKSLAFSEYPDMSLALSDYSLPPLVLPTTPSPSPSAAPGPDPGFPCPCVYRKLDSAGREAETR
jgi:hypothetical protein